MEAEFRQLGCIQVVDKVDVLCRSYAAVQSSIHSDGVLSLVKFGSMNVRRRSNGKEACIPVEKWVIIKDRQHERKSAELLVLRSWTTSTPALPISGERKENVFTDEMNFTARQRVPLAIDR